MRPPPAHVPPAVLDVLATLWRNGHAAYLVGGASATRCSAGRTTTGTWRRTRDPRRIVGPVRRTASYENRFGTVLADHRTSAGHHLPPRPHYADHRRPDSRDLHRRPGGGPARRDFTVNAIAGARGGRSDRSGARMGRSDRRPGRPGRPRAARRRAIRRPLRRGRVAPATRGAPRGPARFRDRAADAGGDGGHAETVRWVSGERVGDEVRRMLGATPPSRAFAILAETGVLGHVLPELDDQRGVAQDKVPGMDSGRTPWPRSMRRRRSPRTTSGCASPRCCTTSASRPPSPTATSSVTISRARGWLRRC